MGFIHSREKHTSSTAAAAGLRLTPHRELSVWNMPLLTTRRSGTNLSLVRSCVFKKAMTAHHPPQKRTPTSRHRQSPVNTETCWTPRDWPADKWSVNKGKEGGLTLTRFRETKTIRQNSTYLKCISNKRVCFFILRHEMAILMIGSDNVLKLVAVY